MERNKTKQNQTKKHEYFSKMISKLYVIKNVELIKFKDIFNPYFVEHTKNFNFFTVQLSLGFGEGESPLNYKIVVSNYVTYNIQSENYTTYTTESANDFLHRVISIYFSHECSPKILPEIEIVFISDLVNTTRAHYLEQQKSMLCRNLIGRFPKSTSQDFGYKWLPESLKNLWVGFTF